MAIEATGNKYQQKTGYIIFVACLIFGAYFLYDGWFSKSYQAKHMENGKPDANLMTNRYYGPITCGIAALYFLVSSIKLSSARIEAKEDALFIYPDKTIPWKSIKQIDKRAFDKSGYFIIIYQDNGNERRLKLSDRKYDNLPTLLDEIIRCTGAKPETEVACKTEQAAEEREPKDV